VDGLLAAEALRGAGRACCCILLDEGDVSCPGGVVSRLGCLFSGGASVEGYDLPAGSGCSLTRCWDGFEVIRWGLHGSRQVY